MTASLDPAFLLDDFYCFGENRDEFEALLRAIDGQTVHIRESSLTDFRLAYLEDGGGDAARRDTSLNPDNLFKRKRMEAERHSAFL